MVFYLLPLMWQIHFLTVKQREKTKVSLVDVIGVSTTFQLGKVLPGLRAGSHWWLNRRFALIFK